MNGALTFLGLALMFGLCIRVTTVLEVVDEYIIYSTAFLFLVSIRAGRIWGLEKWCFDFPIRSRFPALQAFFG